MEAMLTESGWKGMRDFYASGTTRTYQFRKLQLERLKVAIKENEEAISAALFQDLRKSKEEAYTTEIGFMYAEISHALKHLRQWMQPTTVKTPVVLFPSSSKIIPASLGVVLIIAPWNYPFQLMMAPLVGAIAGGNCAVLKPSELTPHTSAIISKIIQETFDPNFIKVIEGDGAQVVPGLMNNYRFDNVFFTGSIAVGKEINKLAAPQLVPVTLELGGKSPCIVDADADLAVAAKRITWGKFTNAGQTCVAPDYVLVHKDRKAELVKHMQQAIHNFYGSNPQQSSDYGRIVNERRWITLTDFLQQGKIIEGGKTDKEDLYISPTLIENVSLDQPIMKEEIFGPLLPVLSFQHHDEALQIIKQNPNPLSLYYFGNKKENQVKFLDEVSFGGGCINNTLVHLANAELPFGGVGNSGVGSYHGKFSFDTFTRPKSVLETATWIDPSVKYPPYKGKLKFLKWFFK
ncbi:aldehyde dehydrogenase family protein [Aridibaculum aurantiacum]|uniref:aldehyde dehydrogenase family protein n=1 Tax=Aridibaculum aurantiacum TaxID=2810307 RepID=UPI001F60862F|nr:aldehyde dehydrogenase family protein [Aridibaculum aurantiacum]